MNRFKSALLPLGLLGSVSTVGIIAISCGTSGPSGPAGGPVAGPQDTHCQGVPPQPVDIAACMERPDGGVGSGVDAAGGGFGPTMYNTSADDDDCKYHVEWSSTPIRENDNVFFTVTATCLGSGTLCTAGAPATGENIFAEVFQGTTHVAPPTNQSATENPPGTYKVGPIQFDDPGSGGSAGDSWSVRFHLHEDCFDLEPDSPHGHAAFYLDVP